MLMKVRALLSLVVVLITMSLTGCGHYNCGTTFGSGSCNGSGGGISTGGGGKGTGLVAYTYTVDFSQAGRTSGGIGTQKLDASAGSFISLTQLVPPLTPPFPKGIAIVGQQYMYIPSSDGTLYSFFITNTSGALSIVGSVDPIAVTGGDSIAASADGKWIFVGDEAGQRVSVYGVNADGTLTAAAGNPFPTLGVSPSVMATDGLSRFVYIAGGPASTQVAAFSIGTGGALTPIGTGLFVTSIGSSMAADPSGKFLLGVSWQSGDNNIHVYSVDGSSGALTTLAPTPTTNTPRTISMHPNGTWVYTGSQDPLGVSPGAVEGFDFSAATGALSPMNGSPFLAIQANGVPIDPSGQFMFALGYTVITGKISSTVNPFSIDGSTGVPTAWPSGSIQAGGFPGIDAAAFAVIDGK